MPGRWARRALIALTLSCAWTALFAPSAKADPVADFYRGKTVTLVVGYGPGGGYDVYARLVGRHLGRHIPGNPTVVVQNMPGAGSLRSVNWLNNLAPRDGTAIAHFARNMPLMGMLGGGLWALVPAVPRAYVSMNEVISTLLLNYVALLIIDYLVFGPWADPTAFNFPYSLAFSDAARLPMLFGDVHLGLVFALLATGVVAAVIGHTVWGYEIRTSGASPGAARYAGMPLTRNILVAMAASGALSGLAGMAEVSGTIFRVQQGISPGYGYSAIIIAWLAKLNPWAAVPVAILFAGLLNGGFALQTSKVPAAITYMIQASVLFLVVAGESLLARVRRTRAAAGRKAALGDAH